MKEIKGMITRYDEEKGFGFIWSSEEELDCFFHVSQCRDKRKIDIGNVVSFNVIKTDKGYRANNIRLVELGREKNQEYNGITCWSGPKNYGDYGLLIHKEQKGDGTFIHKSSLIDGTSEVISNTLYKMDIAKSKDNVIALNAKRIDKINENIIQEIANNEEENPAVRIKAIELIQIIEGKEKEFKKKIYEFNQSNEFPVERTKIRIDKDGIVVDHTGIISDNTVQVVRSVVVGGIGIALAGVGIALISYLSNQNQ